MVRKSQKVIVDHTWIYPRYNTNEPLSLYQNPILIISQDTMHKSVSKESMPMITVSLKNMRKSTSFVVKEVHNYVNYFLLISYGNHYVFKAGQWARLFINGKT